jgi:hypothetical protein
MIHDLIPPAAWMLLIGVLLGTVIVAVTALTDEDAPAACPGGPNAHLDARQWRRETKKGVVRFFCKHCGKFIGRMELIEKGSK